MSYKVLARKWRPQHFRDMLGQEPVLRALINALDSNRLHHAYLFTGMRGVGKTTIARIFAKCLNCETNGVSASPCGQCSACRDIEAGRFFDLIEVDAASRTKVEETRELLENVPYAPASGRYKVYLIDEVHMFSNHSFNALLKTLEEPPEHVKFLLATTDPQKVPVTVLSRCLQFNLKRMASGALADYLGRILTAESIEFERPALELIARASEGSVRDSLSLVEQAAAYGEGAVREAEVESMLGRASVDRLLGLIESLGQNDLPELFERVEQLAEYAPDFNELMGEILSLLHRIALLQSVPGSVPEDTPGFSRLNQLAESLAGDEVQLFYQIGTHARRDMPFAPDPREAFDMALLRMQAFRPEGGLPASAATRIPAAGVVAKARVPEPSAKPATAKPAGPRTGSLSAGVPAATPAASRKPVVIPAQPTTPAPSIASTAGATRTPDTGGAAVTASAGTGSAADGFDTSVSCVASEDRASVGPKDWYRMVSELDVSGMPRQLASNCELVSVEAERVLLHLESASEHLHSARFIERVESALCSWLGRKVRLDVQLVDAVLDTPARIEERVRAEDMAAARQSIDQDPLVRQLIDRVDGSVDEASIAPLNER